MESTQDSGEITRYVEDIVSLKVWVAIEHLYEGLSRCNQDVEGSGLEGYCWVKLEVHNAYAELHWITILGLSGAKVIPTWPYYPPGNRLLLSQPGGFS